MNMFSLITLLLNLWIGAVIFTGVISLAVYVVTSFGVYRLLNNCGYPRAWMGWIPFAREYALGDCACNYVPNLMQTVGNIPVPDSVFKFWFLYPLLSFIPGIGGLLALVVRIVAMMFITAVFYAAVPDRPLDSVIKPMPILCAIFPIVLSVWVLTLPNHPVSWHYRP